MFDIKKIIIIFIILALFSALFGMFLNIYLNRKMETADMEQINMINEKTETMNKIENIAEKKEITVDVSASNQKPLNETEKYIVKSKDGKIVVYQINTNGEEKLYKETDIITKYLTDEDLKLLENGIEADSENKLNKILSDFEE